MRGPGLGHGFVRHHAALPWGSPGGREHDRQDRYRSPRAGGLGAAEAGSPKRFSAKKKLAAVQRLFRGESLETVSRDLAVPAHRLSEWRDRVLLKFKQGGATSGANTALAAAIKNTPHVPASLLGETRLPKQPPPHDALGSKDDAILTVLSSLETWTSTKGALTWLSDTAKNTLKKSGPLKIEDSLLFSLTNPWSLQNPVTDAGLSVGPATATGCQPYSCPSMIALANARISANIVRTHWSCANASRCSIWRLMASLRPGSRAVRLGSRGGMTGSGGSPGKR
ncbi:hypothetical protein SAMN05421720_1045 [Rhodospira trueperi]|uniref:Transposase n=1 Tax=Rhodospira trueperi TaxID=69960 RepID=A0A1G7AMY6_9PROT|nr:hypothetical protein SAMN05421720_1045 [Rhodospira trueperi]